MDILFLFFFFFFNDTATTEIYTLSLHDALPIGIAGPGADQMHHADRGRLMAGAVEQADQLAACADLVTGQRHLADAAGEDAIPEAATRARLIEGAAHLLAEDLGEAC